MRLRSDLYRFWFTPGSAFNLGLCRMIFFGWLYFLYAHYFDGWAYGFSSFLRLPPDFWLPLSFLKIFSSPPISLGAAVFLERTLFVSMIFAALGIWTSISVAVSAVLFTFLACLASSFGDVSHRDFLPAAVMLVFAFSRCGDSVSIDALIRKKPGEPPAASAKYTWPIRLIWVLLVLSYFSAGLTKLRVSGWEWVTSDTIRNYMLNGYHAGDIDRFSHWLGLGVRLAQFPLLCHALALVAVLVEILAPVSLFDRFRWFIVCVLLLHIGIHFTVTADFEAYLALYACWLPWDRILKRDTRRIAVPSTL